MKVIFSYITIIIFTFFSSVSISDENNTNFALPKFYAGGNPYSYLKSPSKEILSKETSKIKCDGFIKPFFGIRTKKEYVFSPTKAATNGLVAILNDKHQEAIFCGESLLRIGEYIGDALVFPFDFDYVPYMPINLRAPWISGIAQGLALGLFSHLYYKTNDKKYLHIANSIFKSYKIPIEKGGFVRYYEDSVLFEEYPTKEFNGVFNGSAVATLALWDYYLISKNEEALSLFRKYIKWLENNIYKYEKVDKKTGVVLSYYSLVVRRAEVLFRFFGDAEAQIEGIAIYGKDKNGKIHKYSLRLGSIRDDDPEEMIYIWADKEYTNWSKRENNGRIINKNKGIYNHSPFYAYLDPDLSELEIEVEYKKFSEKDLELQIYDGREYHLIDNLKGKSNKKDTQRFKVEKKLIDIIVSNLQKEPIVEYKYLDDNYLLLNILSKISDSNVLKTYSTRWKDSVDFVNSEYFNQYPAEFLEKSEMIFDLSTKCSNSINGLSLVNYNDMYYLFYNCEVEKNENRISLLAGKDLRNLKDFGWIFSNNFINDNNINRAKAQFIAFNEIDNHQPNFSLFFINDNNLFMSNTGDLWKWNNIFKMAELSTDSFIISYRQDSGPNIIYIDSSSPNKINLIKLGKTDKPFNLIEEKNYKKFTDISSVDLENINLILARIMLPNRADYNLYIECEEGKFYPFPNNPVIIEKDFINNSDIIKRNHILYSENGFYYIIYTGYYPAKSNPSGIYISKINKNLLKKYISNACHQ